ncbi:hypothetical protein KW805_03965 [Candidatus Pacearchaeota archaeon]|nr:hypothetical protein [Candidatus Pacearchaeota archaeon]
MHTTGDVAVFKEKIGTVYFVDAPLDRGLKLFRDRKASLTTLKELAQIRMEERPLTHKELMNVREGEFQGQINWYSAYTQEAAIYIPKREDILLARHSPLLADAEKVVGLHQRNADYCLANVSPYVEQAEEDKGKHPSQQRVFSLKRTTRVNVPMKRLDESELMLWMFGSKTKDYGLFVNQGKDAQHLHDLSFSCEGDIDSHRKPFVRPLYISQVCDGSYIQAGRTGLHTMAWMFGLKKR